MKLSELTPWEYLLLDREMRTSLSDYYMNAAGKGAGIAFSWRDERNILSYIILFKESSSLRIHYIFTRPGMRRRGYASQLISSILERFKCAFTITISDSIEYADAAVACISSRGFKKISSGSIFTADINDDMWAKMDRLKMVRIKDFLLRDNAECLSFNEMDESVYNQLLNSIGGEFRNKLNPAPFLADNSGITDKNLSTVMLKDGRLCSYAIITRPRSDAVCFEQISETYSKIGAGSVLAPICCAMEKISHCPEIRRMTLHILENNNRSLNFFLSMFSEEELRITCETTYLYSPN